MTVWPEDPRRAEALAKPIGPVADQLVLQGLRRAGSELVGPCPACGGDDRFGINLRKGVFGCRKCGAKGGVIALVMLVQGLDFRGALTWLCGEAVQISSEERAERLRVAAENRRAQEARSERERQASIRRGRAIWEAGLSPEATPVRSYLTLRGLGLGRVPRLPACLRYHPALPYMHEIGGTWRELHRGPAMLAAVQGPDGRFRAVHRTCIDLGQPKGKALILHPDTGEVLKAKKVEGSMKGGAIRLVRGTGDVLVMGEGIETTYSAFAPGALPEASFWAGVSLGNMAGQRVMGKGQRFAGIPDMEDARAFVPPDWVRRLIFVQDGDSDPRTTRAQLEAGLRRAMILRPGLRGQIVHAGEGRDLNDVLLGVPDDE